MSLSHTPKSQPKFHNIQALRALAAIIVVLLHAEGFANNLGFSTWASPFYSLGIAGVDIFFVISGLVMTLTTYHHLGQRPHITTFLKNRLIRIYSNYWILLALAAFLVSLQLYSYLPDVNFWKSITLFPSRGKENMIPVAWTLCYEMFFYLVFSLTILFHQRWFVPFLLTWAAIIIIANGIFIERIPEVTPFYHIFYFSPFHLEFIAGCFIGLAVIHKRSFQPAIIAILGLGLIIATSIIGSKEELSGWNHTILRVATYGTGAAMLVYGTVMLETIKEWRLPNWLHYFGDASYTIYLVHLMGLHLAVQWFYHPWVEGTNSVLLQQFFIVVALSLVLLYSTLHYRWVERPLLTYLRRKTSRNAS